MEDPVLPSVWSEDELAVCARLSGRGAFPTVDPALLDGLPEDARAAVTDAVGRSLLARGLLVLADPAAGRAALHPAVAALLDPALDPERGLVVDRRDTTGRRAWSAWLRNGCAVEVETCGPVGRRVASVATWSPSPAAVDRVGLVPSATGPTDAGEVTVVVDVHACRREGRALVGRLLRLVGTSDGRTARAEEAADGGWLLTPLDEAGVAADLASVIDEVDR